MGKWLKQTFWPNRSNNYQPLFLRRSYLGAVLGFILVLEIVGFVGPLAGPFVNAYMPNQLALVLPEVLNALTNKERKAADLPILKTNPLLNQAAFLKASDMATRGYFSHVSPDGKEPWYWLSIAGYKYEYAGENLAIDFDESGDVTEAWMNSPSHRANIIKNKYTEIGTAVATGTFEGHLAVYTVQLYANPAPVARIQSATIQSIDRQPKIISESHVSAPKKVLGASTEPVIIVTESSSTAATHKNAVWSFFLLLFSTAGMYILWSIILVLITATIIFNLIKWGFGQFKFIIQCVFVIAFIIGLYFVNVALQNFMAANYAGPDHFSSVEFKA
jgi:hypothetical protein